MLILGNWAVLTGAVIDLFRGRTGRGYSLGFPWVAGMAGVVACAFCPVARVRHFAWLPFVLDPSYGLLLWVMVTGPFSRRREPPPPDGPTPEV